MNRESITDIIYLMGEKKKLQKRQQQNNENKKSELS